MVQRKKIVLLGDSAVGKTSLIRRYVFDQFDLSYITTVGSKVTKKNISISNPNKTIALTFMIWDIIGREGYHALHASTFVGAHGAILVADLTRKDTLKNLERYWIPFLYKVVDDVPMVFVGNKSDLDGEYEFQIEEMNDLSKKYNCNVEGILTKGLSSSYSTSAKNGTNVEKAFETLGHLTLSDSECKDPVKKICEIIRSTGVLRNTDKSTPIGGLDAIIIDFCNGFSDSRMAMILIRQEIARAGIDINNPTKKGILKVVEYLAEAEYEFIDEDAVYSNLERRRSLAENISE